MIPRYVIIMRFPVISQTDLFPEVRCSRENQLVDCRSAERSEALISPQPQLAGKDSYQTEDTTTRAMNCQHGGALCTPQGYTADGGALCTPTLSSRGRRTRRGFLNVTFT